MTFHVETDADVHGDHWEVHPEAQEVVACLAGGIRLYFRPEQPDEVEEEVAVAAGSAVIVPRGRWYRIAWTALATSCPSLCRAAAGWRSGGDGAWRPDD